MLAGRLQLLIASATAVFIFLLITLASEATLVPDEVEALKEIAKTLMKKDWDFSVDPCSGDQKWNTSASKENMDAVTCNCSYERSTACHLIRIELKSQSLPGTLPAELVRLPYLQVFDVSRNHLSGNIPPIWGTMQLVQISLNGNRISGTIPKEIGNISTLATLTQDFNQLSEAIPPELGNLSRLEKLTLMSNNWTGVLPETLAKLTTLNILRIGDSNFVGSIPSSIQNWKNLGQLDLSFNKLNGQIPPRYVALKNTDYIYLTGNNFTGSVPPWMLSAGGNFGISYNRFTSGKLGTSRCQAGKLNLFESSSKKNTPGIVSCSQISCSQNWSFLCIGRGGGGGGKIGDTIYEGDTDSGWPSKLFSNGKYWASSSTGHFMDGQDFNIEEEASGVNKPIVKNYTANVTDNALEIRFYLAGKGTTEIPNKGVSGPLISAISVDPGHRVSVGAIGGIVFAGLVTISLFLVIHLWKGCLRRREAMAQELRGLDLQTGSFTLRQIKMATNNFDVANKIGEGGFGSVYKGNLSDGTIIAVKQFSSESSQGNHEFLNEIGMISALDHPNLVKLYGCCIEGNQLLLVYEYMENNSLGRALFGSEEVQLKLDWPTRQKICVGIARGLAYLHEESRLRIVHRDIKATNVLLGKELNPKISDFGLAKLHEEENTHIIIRIAGTLGYMAPEYAMRGYLTDKADVYSFGVVLLEIVSGKSNTSIKPKQECFYLLDWARLLKKEGRLMDLVDSRMEPDFNKDQVMLTIEIALLCTDVSPTARPSMSTVVSMLEGRVIDQKLILDSSALISMENPKEITDKKHLLSNSNKSQSLSMYVDLPFTASSTSASDLCHQFDD